MIRDNHESQIYGTVQDYYMKADVNLMIATEQYAVSAERKGPGALTYKYRTTSEIVTLVNPVSR